MENTNDMLMCKNIFSVFDISNPLLTQLIRNECELWLWIGCYCCCVFYFDVYLKQCVLDGIYQANAILNKFECRLLCGSASPSDWCVRLVCGTRWLMMEAIMKFYSILWKECSFDGMLVLRFPTSSCTLKFWLALHASAGSL